MSRFRGRDLRAWVMEHFMLCILVACLMAGGVAGYSGYLIGLSSAEIPVESSDIEDNPLWYINTDVDTDEYLRLYNDVIAEYYDVLEGKEIVTVATVNRTMSGKLYAQTQDGTDGIGFEFDKRDVPLATQPGDVVTIAGVLSSDRRHGTTITHCEIVGLGEIGKELKYDADNQRSQLLLLRPAEPLNSSEIAEQLADICSSMTLMWPTVTRYLRG